MTLQDALYGEAVRVAVLQATVKEGELDYAGGVLDHAATLALAPSQVHLGDELLVEMTPGTVRLQGSWAPDAPYRATVKIADAGFAVVVTSRHGRQGLAGLGRR